MKNKKLVIEKNKIKIIKENFTWSELAPVFAVKEITSTLSDVLKIASANIKYAIEFILSFRSLSIKKIYENMKKADDKFARRVRIAMRSIGRTNETLSSNSYINEAFMFSAPAPAIVDYFRERIDSEGGIRYFLKNEDQNIYIGSLIEDVYSFYESGVEKIIDKDFFNDKSSSDKSSSDKSSSDKISAQKEEYEKIRNVLVENFGKRGFRAIEDFSKGRFSNKDALAIKIILENNNNLPEDELSKKLFDFLEELNKNDQSSINEFLKSISKQFSKSNESKIIIRNNRILNENKVTNQYKKLISQIGKEIYRKNSNKILSNFDPSSDISKDVLEDRLKSDIKEYEDMIDFLLIETLVLLISLEYSKEKKLNFKKSFSVLDNISKSLISKESKTEIENKVQKLKSNFESSKEEELIPLLISLLNKIKNSNFSIDKKYLDNLNKFSNGKDENFIKLKSSFKKLYKIHSNTNITNTMTDLQKILIEKATDEK